MNYLKYLIPLLIAFPVSAQEMAKPSDPNDKYLSISVENDSLGGGTDRFYTSGVRATWFDSDIKVPRILRNIANEMPNFDFNDQTASFYSIGQNLYTPEDITIRADQPDDRPWAGFIYASVGMANITQNKNKPFHVDELEFTIGLVGPEALGEQTQKAVHKYVSNSPKPEGWDNQLGLEPGFIVSWQRRIPYFMERDIGPLNVRLEPNISASLGTIRTNIGAGAAIVLGSERLLDTPPRVRPAVPGTGIFLSEDHKFNWQIFAGADGRVVGRNIFLDGNTFKNSPSVDKEYFVGDLSSGISLFYDDYRLSYTINYRTKEFKTQQDDSVFGSLTLTKRF